VGVDILVHFSKTYWVVLWLLHLNPHQMWWSEQLHFCDISYACAKSERNQWGCIVWGFLIEPVSIRNGVSILVQAAGRIRWMGHVA